MILNYEKLHEIARKQYNEVNSKYDNKEYIYHIDAVSAIIDRYQNVFIHNNDDFINTKIASLFHDSIEDARQSYNNILENTNKDIADIVLAVTDVPSSNRLMKHLLTMVKTVADYRAIILKMCDILANATYSYEHNDSMYCKYKKEYL
jgi:(p)ppGpp synthase/HD superfamily hydrolase